jgi:aspartate aminotransferase-like enzyme
MQMVDVHFDFEDGNKLKLFTPGPVYIPERILKELAKPNDTHRSLAYQELHESTVKGLQKLLYTKNNCLIFTSSATGVMEACIRNLLNSQEKGLILSCGAFGNRWDQIGKACGKKIDKIEIEWGTGFSEEQVKDALSKDKYDVVTIQFVETSTGVYNHLDEIAPIIKHSGALLCVDATSGIAGIKLEADKLGIDVCLASVQKCLTIPPGLAVASISEDALNKAKSVQNRGLYFDFVTLMKYSTERHQTPNTPPIPQIRALNAELKYITEIEGLDNRFQRHKEMGETVQNWVDDMGMEMFSAKGYESPTVSTIKNNLHLDLKKVVNTMLEKGYRIVNGYGDLSGKTFRIGHMGELTVADVKELLKVLSEIIKK